MKRIFLATKDRDEHDWLSEELADYGRIVRTIDSLNFFVPQWESLPTEVLIFLESVVESEESFIKLVKKIRLEQPDTTIMFIYYRDEDEFIHNISTEGANCINFIELEPGLVEQRLASVAPSFQPSPLTYPPKSDESHEPIIRNTEEIVESIEKQSVALVVENEIDAEEDYIEKSSLSETAREIGRQIGATSTKLFNFIENKKSEIQDKKKKSTIDEIRPEEFDFDPIVRNSNTKKRSKERFVGTAVIALTGVERGVGCTHTAIMLANHLAQQDYTVALVEVNDSNDYVEIERAYEGVKDSKQLKNPTFTINGVRYFKNVKELNMVNLLTGNFSFIILDLGSYTNTNWYNEFLRASIPIVVGSASEWKHKDIYRFFQSQIHEDQSNWKLCVPLAKKINISDIKKNLPKRKIHGIPFHSDPYEKNKIIDEVLEDILKLQQHQKLNILKKKMQAIFRDQ